MFTLFVFVFGVVIGVAAHDRLVADELNLAAELKAELAKLKPSLAALKSLVGKR